MKKILFIDAAVRSESRTRRIAEYLISKLDGETEHLMLAECGLKPLNAELLEKRNICSEKKDFSDPYFDTAKKFAEADIIVIAAPYWDYSFPALLKEYLETVCVTGLTFRYLPDGRPEGLCRAEKLYYVTTAGGYITNDAFGPGYVKTLANELFGIAETHCVKAEGLDIDGADVEKIIASAKAAADAEI